MLSIENFRKRYDDFELDCTMSVEPGQITGIVGANGAGKEIPVGLHFLEKNHSN